VAELNRFQCLVRKETIIREAIAMMGSSPLNKHIAGIVVVVDDNKQVIGVVTDGDVRRGLSRGIGVEQPVGTITNLNPMTIDHRLNPMLMYKVVKEKARQRNAHYLKYDKLVLVNADETFFDVITLADILEPQIEDKAIAVYGLGFVGLTLACTFANAGLSVVGIDTNTTLITGLKSGIAPFYEKGLDSMLSSLAVTNPIVYTTNSSEHNADIHVVSVGSPVNSDGIPDLSYITEASQTIAKGLKHGNLIVFRSTVPVGTMRNIVLPILEASGLSCGRDFYLAFAPERTVEGNALEELRLLPQIVGGFNTASTSMAAALFRRITNTIIEVDSLEEAELVKLMNNTFRDLVFSFANEVAAICDGYNINAFDIIRAANEGYPRDRIPMPSPGVGGICLSKDPYLYTSPIAPLKKLPVLGRASRSINSDGASYVYTKLSDFAKRTGQSAGEMNVLIVGLAFKGMPETSDIRASVALDLIGKFQDRSRIRVKDFVVPPAVISELGCVAVESELDESFVGIDAVLVMNNHYRNTKFNVVEALRRCNHPVLFFDGWNMFDQREIESLGNVCYATMGYMTPAYRD
jgi:nucleotide sugar dehydrogenase